MKLVSTEELMLEAEKVVEKWWFSPRIGFQLLFLWGKWPQRQCFFCCFDWPVGFHGGFTERIPSGNRGNGNPIVIRGSSPYVKRFSIATLDYQGYLKNVHAQPANGSAWLTNIFGEWPFGALVFGLLWIYCTSATQATQELGHSLYGTMSKFWGTQLWFESYPFHLGWSSVFVVSFPFFFGFE